MKDVTKGFTPKRIEDVARAADAINRARSAADQALAQASDKLRADVTPTIL